MKKRYSALRGTRDILPGESHGFELIERTARRIFGNYGFREIRTPILEPTELFLRSVGSSSDIVSKQMYTFAVGDESVSLRPENTAPVVRAFVEHSLFRNVAEGYPERYFYLGPMFRHERPQKGRQRQFHQIGVEVLGAGEPLADAETIRMSEAFLDALGLSGRELAINSVGDGACRPAYREKLREWIEPRLSGLCEDCRRRFHDNPLRVFDCKVEQDRQLLREAPALADMLCGPCHEHFDRVQRLLEGYGVRFAVDPRMVRGLDYYERTVFEVLHSGLGAQNAILGGGRYDGLVEELGGPAIPGFGFAMGIERLMLLMPAERLAEPGVDVAVIALGDEALAAAVALVDRLRAAGVSALMPLVERPVGAQLKRAEKNGARHALFLGREELNERRYGLKDLRTGEQSRLTEGEVLARLSGAGGSQSA